MQLSQIGQPWLTQLLWSLLSERDIPAGRQLLSEVAHIIRRLVCFLNSSDKLGHIDLFFVEDGLLRVEFPAVVNVVLKLTGRL